MNDKTPNKQEPDEGKAFEEGIEHGYTLGWNDAIIKAVVLIHETNGYQYCDKEYLIKELNKLEK